jgi:hypothetical protein
LEDCGFDLVVECALGAQAAWFDRIILHTFPDASRKARDIWSEVSEREADPKLVRAFETPEDCGILAHSLAQKAVSTSFVGAVAGAFVTGEILRALNGGMRCELIQLQLRHEDSIGVVPRPEDYAKRVARSGFLFGRQERSFAA